MSIPPTEVLREFHRTLVTIIDDYEENLIPVLRGSLVMKHWFGDKARPAADIDLECFEGPSNLPEDEQAEYHNEYPDRFGQYREYVSLVDFGKAMCRYAAESTSGYRYDPRGQSSPPPIEFYAIEPPDPNTNLWVYGTPGERYYTGWRITGSAYRSASLKGKQGQLQIDIAQPGTYKLSDIGTATMDVPSNQGTTIQALTYSRGMMLAAKLSWLIRSFEYSDASRLQWQGEPKDLFDIQLLVCEGEIEPEDFQNSLVAIGIEDDLNWRHLVEMIDRSEAINDQDFGNWSAFVGDLEKAGCGDLVALGPAESLRLIARRLPTLLGYFWIPEEEPFVQAIHSNPADRSGYLIYADWLEEHGDMRADFLRRFSELHCADSKDATEDELATRHSHCLDRMKQVSQPWLHRLFGQGKQLAAVRGRMEAKQV